MLNKFQNIIYNEFPDIQNYSLYVACSGGIDSMVLTDLLLSSEFKPTLLHCNFNLRGKESDDDQSFIEEFAQRNALTVKVKSFNTKSIAQKNNENIQLTARKLRYEWFKTFENKHTLILTAHHLNDSVETIFMNLLRGTGFKGTTGIPAINATFYRPLLKFTRSDIEEYAKLKEIEFREDSSNATLDYRRNNLRHKIIPLFNELEPEFMKKMYAFIEESTLANEFIQSKLTELKTKLVSISEKDLYSVSLSAIKKLSTYEKKYIFSDYGIYRKNADEFISFLNSSTGSIFRTNTYEFSIDRNKVFIRKRLVKDKTLSFEVNIIPSVIHLNGSSKLSITKDNDPEITLDENIQKLDFEKITLPLNIRKWKYGDKLQPLGMKGSKLVSDVLIDKKIPQHKKDQTVVVIDGLSNIICIPGILINDQHKITKATSKVLKLSLQKIQSVNE